MVEHGHEARVFMVQNSNVVVTMFDKDYGGRHNERYFKIKVKNVTIFKIYLNLC